MQSDGAYMEIVCPYCKRPSTSAVDLEEGQHVRCPYCNGLFPYNKDDNLRKCSPSIAERASFCNRASSKDNEAESHLFGAIVATVLNMVFCCYGLPGIGLGIVAIIFSVIADKRLSMHDLRGAKQASKLSMVFMYVSFGLVAAFILIITISVLIRSLNLN